VWLAIITADGARYRQWGLIGAGALATLAPLFAERGVSAFWRFSTVFAGHDPGVTVPRSLWQRLDALSHIVVGGAPLGPDRPLPWPLLNPVEAVLVGAGLGVCLFRWRQKASMLPVWWVLVAVIAALCSSEPDNGRRLCVVLPALATLMAVSLVATYDWCVTHAPRISRYLVPVGLTVVLVVDLSFGAPSMARWLYSLREVRDGNMARQAKW
jgi:hypothetical protein